MPLLAAMKTLAARLAVLEQRSAMPPPKVAAEFYTSPAWRALLDRIIAVRGRRCEDPACARVSPVTRVFGDHIVELADGGAPLDERNVMLRCGSCHTRKTAEQRAARTARYYGR
jgi:5-methylcytosine-specific restriction protein A